MNVNKQMKKLGMGAGIGVIAALSSTATSAATIGFTQGDQIINPTDPQTFVMDLVASNLVYDTNGGSLLVSFDSSILSIVNATIGSSWGFGSQGTIGAGSYDFSVADLGGVITGNQTLVSIEFAVIGTGTTTLILSETLDSLGNIAPWGYTLTSTAEANGIVPSGEYCLIPGQYDCTSPNIDPDTIITLFDTVVTVNAPSAVPVPAAVWLFGSGLIGLVAVSRRKTV